MPTVRYTDDGGRYRVAGVTFEPGDTADVSAGLAEHLVEETDSFERVSDVSDEELDDAIEAIPDAVTEDDGNCGYEKDDGSVCQRTAGWGRDADTGRCSDHHGED